jgi:hypothetical protein
MHPEAKNSKCVEESSAAIDECICEILNGRVSFEKPATQTTFSALDNHCA